MIRHDATSQSRKKLRGNANAPWKGYEMTDDRLMASLMFVDAKHAEPKEATEERRIDAAMNREWGYVPENEQEAANAENVSRLTQGNMNEQRQAERVAYYKEQQAEYDKIDKEHEKETLKNMKTALGEDLALIADFITKRR